MLISGSWAGFSVESDAARCSLVARLARLYPEPRLMLFSVPRKPTAEACVEAFEQAYRDGADWIFWIEDDVIVPPETFERLRQCADPEKRPVISALSFFRQPPYWPSILQYDRVDGKPDYGRKPMPWCDYPRNRLVQVDATGMCAVLVHRSVLERIQKPWFSWIAQHENGHTPDGMFMYRLAEAGIPMFCHTGVKVGHERTWTVTESTWDAWLREHGDDEAKRRAVACFRPSESASACTSDA